MPLYENFPIVNHDVLAHPEKPTWSVPTKRQVGRSDRVGKVRIRGVCGSVSMSRVQSMVEFLLCGIFYKVGRVRVSYSNEIFE